MAVRELSKAYGATTALDSVSFDICKDQITALLGVHLQGLSSDKREGGNGCMAGGTLCEPILNSSLIPYLQGHATGRIWAVSCVRQDWHGLWKPFTARASPAIWSIRPVAHGDHQHHGTRHDLPVPEAGTHAATVEHGQPSLLQVTT